MTGSPTNLPRISANRHASVSGPHPDRTERKEWHRREPADLVLREQDQNSRSLRSGCTRYLAVGRGSSFRDKVNYLYT